MIGQFFPIFASITIDVDLSAVYMGLLFLVLFLIFTPLLIKPFMKAMEAREEATGGAREDADADTKAAEAKIAEYEETMKGIRNEANDIRESLRGQGSAESKEVIEEVQNELSKKIASERELIEKNKIAALAEIKTKSNALADSIVGKILPSGATS